MFSICFMDMSKFETTPHCVSCLMKKWANLFWNIRILLARHVWNFHSGVPGLSIIRLQQYFITLVKGKQPFIQHKWAINGRRKKAFLKKPQRKCHPSLWNKSTTYRWIGVRFTNWAAPTSTFSLLCMKLNYLIFMTLCEL